MKTEHIIGAVVILTTREVPVNFVQYERLLTNGQPLAPP